MKSSIISLPHSLKTDWGKKNDGHSETQFLEREQRSGSTPRMPFFSFSRMVQRTLNLLDILEGCKQNPGAERPPDISGTPWFQPAQKPHAWILTKEGAQYTMRENQQTCPSCVEGRAYLKCRCVTAAKARKTPFLPAVGATDVTTAPAALLLSELILSYLN